MDAELRDAERRWRATGDGHTYLKLRDRQLGTMPLVPRNLWVRWVRSPNGVMFLACAWNHAFVSELWASYTMAILEQHMVAGSPAFMDFQAEDRTWRRGEVVIQHAPVTDEYIRNLQRKEELHGRRDP